MDNAGSPNCHSPLTTCQNNRLRWECRRGMLELDIVLARFLEHDFSRLTPQEVKVFGALLDYPDNDLWVVLQSGKMSDDTNLNRVLSLLRQC